MGVILFDDFLGSSLDLNKWDAYERISDQANLELCCMRAANISVAGSLLSGVSQYVGVGGSTCGDSVQSPTPMDYTSWQIAARQSPFLYGDVRVRAKLPGGIGIWPTIFLLGYEWQKSQAATANVPGANWPVAGWCEIDVAEFLDNARTQVNNVVHFGTAGGRSEQALPFDATSRFMIYGVRWRPNSLIWTVDAEDGVGERTLRTVSGAGNVPDVPMYLTINSAVGGIGTTAPDSATFPQTYGIDWVYITQDGGPAKPRGVSGAGGPISSARMC